MGNIMKIYLITYDLRVPGKDNTGLYEAIKGIGTQWYHPLESVWIVKSPLENADDIYRGICDAIDSSDRLFVVEINNDNKQGWLAKQFWEWLNN